MWKRTASISQKLETLTEGKRYDEEAKQRWLKCSIRCTIPDDFQHIQTLDMRNARKTFGRVDLLYLLEVCNLSYTIVGEDRDIYGLAMFSDFPNYTPSILTTDNWVTWIKENIEEVSSDSMNTLFLHYFISIHKTMSTQYLKKFLDYMFLNQPYLKYCCFVLSDQDDRSDFKSVFQPAAKIGDFYTMYMVHRRSRQPEMHIRTGGPEDYDDIMDIIRGVNPSISEEFGPYYFYEKLLMVAENTSMLVAEVDEASVGVILLTANVNTELLNENFSLEHFNELRKPWPSEENKESDASTVASEKLSAMSEVSDQGTKVLNAVFHTEEAYPLPHELGSVTAEAQTEEELEETEEIVKESATVLDKVGSKATRKESLSAQSADSATMLASYESSSMKENAPENVQPLEPTESELGQINTFCINLLCMKKECEFRSVEFLYAAFSEFPDLDYCLISLPYSCFEIPILKHFTRLTPMPEHTFSEVLYLCHKPTLLSCLSVKFVEDDDFERLSFLVEKMKLPSKLILNIKKAFTVGFTEDRMKMEALLAELSGDVVGFVVLRHEGEAETNRFYYYLEDFIEAKYYEDSDYAHLIHFYILPGLQHLTRAFLREVLHSSKKKALSFTLPPMHQHLTDEEKTLLPLLEEFVAVRPRKPIVYPSQESPYFPTKETILAEPTYALYNFSKKISMKDKRIVNDRIIVVGASETGMGVLEHLVFESEIQFNYLTLISPQGLPSELPPDEIREMLQTQSFSYGQKTMGKLGLHYHVNIIKGTVASIDRKNKIVRLKSKQEIVYDYLVLCCGTQYTSPTQKMSAYALEIDELRFFDEDYPDNLFIINDQFDAAKLVMKAKDFVQESEEKVIIYGCTLDAYCCIATLMAMGVKGIRIELIKPTENSQRRQRKYRIHDSAIEGIINDELMRKHVVVEEDWRLVNWVKYSGTNVINTLTFKDSSDKKRYVRCCMFVSYSNSAISLQTFLMLRTSGLVLDGGLVIDANFKAMDPYIFAGGPMAKPSRRYFFGNWSHDNFSSREMGKHIADSIVRTVETPQKEEEEPFYFPDFKEPVIVYAELPGGWQYLHVRKPEPVIAPRKKNNKVMHTGSLAGRKSYFRLELDEYDTVHTIVCISRQIPDATNLTSLYGLHEWGLKGVLELYNEGRINDFFSFFRQPWVFPLYHSSFPRLKQNVLKLLSTRDELASECFSEEVEKLLEERNMKLKPDDLKKLWKSYSLHYEQGVKEALVKYLTENSRALPMCWLPDQEEITVN